MKAIDWEAIVMYMDDEAREQVHSELAPCTCEEFMKRYLELDPDFEENILHREFGLEVINMKTFVVINDHGGVYVRTDDEQMAKFALEDAEKEYPNDTWIVMEE